MTTRSVRASAPTISPAAASGVRIPQWQRKLYARLPAARRHARRWVLVATAHPAKFSEIVEPLIGTAVPVPRSLAALFELPRRETAIDATLSALENFLTLQCSIR